MSNQGKGGKSGHGKGGKSGGHRNRTIIIGAVLITAAIVITTLVNNALSSGTPNTAFQPLVKVGNCYVPNNDVSCTLWREAVGASVYVQDTTDTITTLASVTAAMLAPATYKAAYVVLASIAGGIPVAAFTNGTTANSVITHPVTCWSIQYPIFSANRQVFTLYPVPTTANIYARNILGFANINATSIVGGTNVTLIWCGNASQANVLLDAKYTSYWSYSANAMVTVSIVANYNNTATSTTAATIAGTSETSLNNTAMRYDITGDGLTTSPLSTSFTWAGTAATSKYMAVSTIYLAFNGVEVCKVHDGRVLST